MAELSSAHGVVARGHRVASGRGGDPRFPEGTIAPQLPFLQRAIDGFDAYLGGAPFPGTLNLRFEGSTMRILRPEHHLRGVEWTPLFPPEDFFLSRCAVEIGGERHAAFLYMPDPVTKPDHPQPGSVVEALARFIPGVRYGAPAVLHYSPEAIALIESR